MELLTFDSTLAVVKVHKPHQSVIKLSSNEGLHLRRHWRVAFYCEVGIQAWTEGQKGQKIFTEVPST